MSASTSLPAAALHSYELRAFAVVQKPFDIGQLFATIERALERRRMNLDNRRLVWELQTIDQIADGIARRWSSTTVLRGALRCLTRAPRCAGGSIRLQGRGPWVLRKRRSSVHVDPPLVARQACFARATGSSRTARPTGRRPARRIASRRHLRPPVLSTLSVPMIAGDELLGTMSVGAETPGRFELADQRLVAT